MGTATPRTPRPRAERRPVTAGGPAGVQVDGGTPSSPVRRLTISYSELCPCGSPPSRPLSRSHSPALPGGLRAAAHSALQGAPVPPLPRHREGPATAAPPSLQQPQHPTPQGGLRPLRCPALGDVRPGGRCPWGSVSQTEFRGGEPRGATGRRALSELTARRQSSARDSSEAAETHGGRAGAPAPRREAHGSLFSRRGPPPPPSPGPWDGPRGSPGIPTPWSQQRRPRSWDQMGPGTGMRSQEKRSGLCSTGKRSEHELQAGALE